MLKWDKRFLRLAREVSTWSKDPNTKVGAVITDPDHRVISLGYNGFPRLIRDDGRLLDREFKNRLVVHAEANALLSGPVIMMNPDTIYTWPFMPCSMCAGLIIQAGLYRVIAPDVNETNEAAYFRWADSFTVAREMFDEATVILKLEGGDIDNGDEEDREEDYQDN